MSTITATGFQNRIEEYAAEHMVELPRSKARRMANEVKRRIERMTDTERERVFMHSDPVPCEALHHLLGRTPCRRCGRVPTH